MNATSAGRKVRARWPTKVLAAFRKPAVRRGLEGQFLGVVGVVDGQGEGGARLDGRQPLDLVFGQDAAVRQAHQAGAGFGGGVDDSVQDDAGVFHGGVR